MSKGGSGQSRRLVLSTGRLHEAPLEFKVLDDVSGVVRPGTLTLVLAPPWDLTRANEAAGVATAVAVPARQLMRQVAAAASDLPSSQRAS